MALDFDAVADELYGMAPQEFTAKRDLYAADARRAGDRELASEIKALKRPTTSAWLANQLVRQRPELVTELLEVGAAMLDAQERLDGEQLRRLSLQRRRLGATIAEAGRKLARSSGQSAGDAVERELQSTLDAAVADTAAGEALQRGRLTTALSAAGFGRLGGLAPSDGGARRQRLATIGGAERQPATSRGTGKGASAGSRIRGEEHRLRREQEAADREAVAARASAEKQSKLEAAAEAEQEKVRKGIAEAEQQLQRLRGEATSISQQLGELRREHRRAERAAVDAERRATRARQSLDEALSGRQDDGDR
jgi:hypothetical protein